jgi:hypothetical protein
MRSAFVAITLHVRLLAVDDKRPVRMRIEMTRAVIVLSPAVAGVEKHVRRRVAIARSVPNGSSERPQADAA